MMNSPYKKLVLTISINAVIMFLLTYTLIDGLEHFHANINRAYMALLMVMPMVVLMMLVMGGMYKNKQLNAAIITGAVVIFALLFFLARTQTPVGNEQFLRSMIPHHSSAILMCEESAITDPEILQLCDEIVAAQEREIAEMEAILTRLNE